MSEIPIHDRQEQTADVPPTGLSFANPVIIGALCLAVLVAAIPWQARWGLVADTSWIMTVAERMLAGDRLYVEILETNPPFTIWLYLPPVALASWLGLSPELVVSAYIYALCTLGLGFAGYIVWHARLAGRHTLLALSPVFLALLVILPGNAFSQREHAAVALLLPLLALTAWRADDDADGEPSRGLAIAAGLLGSVIVLVKPYYVVVILATAFYLGWRRRGIRPLFGLEYWTAAISTLAYLGAVFAFYPAFIRDFYPLLSDTYLRFKGINTLFMAYAFFLAMWSVAFLLLARRGTMRPLTLMLVIASVAAYLPLFYQGKGWPYHAYPAIALGLGALLCQLGTAAPADGRIRSRIGRLVAFALLAIAVIPFTKTQRPGDHLVAALRATTNKPVVAMVGSDIAVGHPLTRMIGGSWLSAYCSDWLGSMAAYLALEAAAAGDEAEASRYAAMSRDYAGAKMAELGANPPDVLLVQIADVFWIDYMSRREDFAAFWSHYRLLAEDGTIAAYVKDAPKSASPAAASG